MQTSRQTRRIAREAHAARMHGLQAAARAIVATGTCPDCGRALRRNLALAGWWQCSQFGAVNFRADATAPACSFQTFTE